VEHDRALRMKPAALGAAIAADRQQGNVPVAVIASAGAVNTGAIDPLDEIADVCAEHNVWLHVDGAYGGPAVLSQSYGALLASLSRADSLALDPHKWLYVPVEAGMVLVRDAEAMRSTFSLVPPYLRTDGKLEGVGGLPWFSEFGFQQTREFRALKVWMALKYHGLAGYRASIERDISFAQKLAGRLRESGEFEVFEPQSLSIVCFRFAPREFRREALVIDQMNKAVLEEVQLGGQVFLSSTMIDGRFWLRACIVNHRARVEDMETLVDVVSDRGRAARRRMEEAADDGEAGGEMKK
jgi:glutamate/tyrosine decarboxylase-like PLP-dependent enzyme